MTAGVGRTTIITIASSPEAEASVFGRGLTVTGFNIRKHRETPRSSKYCSKQCAYRAATRMSRGQEP